jgi:hypothetical protein
MKDRAPLRGIKSHFHQTLGVAGEDFSLSAALKAFGG